VYIISVSEWFPQFEKLKVTRQVTLLINF
jgi:hypothetical protein